MLEEFLRQGAIHIVYNLAPPLMILILSFYFVKVFKDFIENIYRWHQFKNDQGCQPGTWIKFNRGGSGYLKSYNIFWIFLQNPEDGSGRVPMINVKNGYWVGKNSLELLVGKVEEINKKVNENG